MDYTTYENSCIKMFTTQHKEAKLVDGYVTFEIIDNSIQVEQYFFYEDNIKLKSTEDFLFQSVSLIDDLYQYKSDKANKSLDITGGILVFNEGLVSIAWL